MIKYIDEGHNVPKKPVYRLDSLPSNTFASNAYQLTEEDFTVGTQTLKRLNMWQADGSQQPDLVIGSQSYFQKNLTMRDQNVISKSSESPLPKDPSSEISQPKSSQRKTENSGPSSFMGSKNSLKSSSLQSTVKTSSASASTKLVLQKSSKQSMLQQIPEFPEIGEQFIEEDDDDVNRQMLIKTTEASIKQSILLVSEYDFLSGSALGSS